MMRASIWGQDIHGVIGDGAAMLWRVPADFAFFKEQTTGCPIIMGRSSFEALGRPLPNRANIVLTRDVRYSSPGIVVVHSLDEAFAVAEAAAEEMGASTVWVTGGGHVYAETMDMVDRLVVTYLDIAASAPAATDSITSVGTVTTTDLDSPAADNLVFAPVIDPQKWAVVTSESDEDWREHSGDARWMVRVYDRREPRS